MPYAHNFGGPRFTQQDLRTLSATTKSKYISDLVIDAASFLYGREAMLRLLSVAIIRPLSLYPYTRSIDSIMKRLARTLAPERRPNLGTTTVGALHRIEHVMIPIFDVDIDHWSVVHILPRTNMIYVIDSLRPQEFKQRARSHRLAPGASHLTPAESHLWESRNPPLLSIIQTVECMRTFEACNKDLYEALEVLHDTGHTWPMWTVVEAAHASPQAGAECGIMTLLYMRAVCKGQITDPGASTIQGGKHAHKERETIHDHLLSWNLRGLERLDIKYAHHTPMMVLEGVLIHHVITDEERCGDPIDIVCIVRCSADLEDSIVGCLYHILQLAGIPKSCLTVHRARLLLPDDDAWSRATLFVNLFTDAYDASTKRHLPSYTAYEEGLRESIAKLVSHAHGTDSDTGVTNIYPLTVVAGLLCTGLDRIELFPHSCYRTPGGRIIAPSGREMCENWYITCTSSFGETEWSTKPGSQCQAFIGLPSDVYIPCAEEHAQVFTVEHKYMTLGLANDVY